MGQLQGQSKENKIVCSQEKGLAREITEDASNKIKKEIQ